MKRTSFIRLLAVLLLCLPVSAMAMSTADLEQKEKDIQSAAKAKTADLTKQLADLQKTIKSATHGWGFLNLVKNGTLFDADFIVEKQTVIEDKLGKGAIVRIKALAGPYKDMYYTITPDGEFKPTTKDQNEKTALFGIDRFADMMLNEWFGISYPPQATDANYLQCVVAPNQNLQRLITLDADSADFTNLTNNNAHLKIIGDDITLCRIVDAAGGNVHMAKYQRLDVGKAGPAQKFYDPNECWSIDSNWDLSALAEPDGSNYLKYNTPVAIKEAEPVNFFDCNYKGDDQPYMASNFGARPCEVFVGQGNAGQNRSQVYTPQYYFLLSKAGNPKSIGTVHYGDTVEIIAAAPKSDCQINPAGAKICVAGKDTFLGIAIPGGNRASQLTDGTTKFKLTNPDPKNPTDTSPISLGGKMYIESAADGFAGYQLRIVPARKFYGGDWSWKLIVTQKTNAPDNLKYANFIIEKAPQQPQTGPNYPANPKYNDTYGQVVRAFNLDALKVTKTYKDAQAVDSKGFNFAQVAMHYQRAQPSKTIGKFEAWAVALVDRTDPKLGVVTDRKLVHRNDDGTWTDLGIIARWVCAGSEEGVWYVSDDYAVTRLDVKKSLGAPPAGIVQVAGQVKAGIETVWALGKDGHVYRLDPPSNWVDTNIGRNAVNLVMSCGKENPIAYAVDDKGELLSCDTGDKKAMWGPESAPAPGLLQVSPRGYTEQYPDGYQYGIGSDNKLYFFDGNTWTMKSTNQDNRGYAMCMSGAYDGQPPQTYTLNSYETATTANIPDGCILYSGLPDPNSVIDGTVVPDVTKAYPGKQLVDENSLKADTDGATAGVGIELVQPGIGGSLNAGNQFIFGRFPIASRDPSVIGYGETTLANFTESSMLTLSSMKSKGAAWIGQALSTPGNATVSFLARSDGGGVHVIFGTFAGQMRPEFDWRVVIGGASGKGKSSWIEKGIIGNDGKITSTRVCEVTADQNPLAAGSPGNFVPYAVSIDDGLILVTMGGTAFMAWRDPDPGIPANYAGFGSDDTKVAVTQIQVLPPMVAVVPKRLFVQSKNAISLTPGPAAIVWGEHPFRVPDEGSVAFTIKGESKVAVALGQDKDNTLPHYLVTFGDVDDKGDDGISIKKFQADTSQYLLRAFLPSGPYEDLKKRSDIDPSKALSFKLDPAQNLDAWVCYKDGQIFVGLGDAKHIGSNVLMVLNDINPYTEIREIGFGALGNKPATIESVAIADDVALDFEKAAELYKTPATQFKVKGNFDIIKPFELQITQVEANIVVHDAIANQNYITAATPNAGKNYNFMLNIQPNGYPVFAKSADADDSDIKTAETELFTQVDAQTTLLQAQKDSISAQGQLAQKLASAASDEQKAQADAIMRTNDATNTAAATVIQATGGDPLTANIGMGVGVAMMVAGTAITSALATQRNNEAAADDRTGKEAAVAADARAQTLDDAAAKLAQAKSLAEGDANAAFEGADKYVYTDKVPKDTTGTLTVPPDAAANAKTFATNVNAAAKLTPITEKNIAQFVSTMQAALDVVTNVAVVADAATKKKAYANLSALLTAYEKLLATAAEDSDIHALCNDVITLLFTAYNNIVFADVTVADEKKAKDSWYVGINTIARTLLADPKLDSFTVDAWYGMPVFFPQKLATPDRGSIKFKVKGEGDLFIGLTREPANVRNVQPPVELYEVVINGCSGTTTGVRFESLGKMIAKVTTDDNPAAAFNALDWQDYWVNFDNGKIEVGTGNLDPANVILTCVDPYPVGGFTELYVSSWDSECSISSIVIGPSMYPAPAAPAPQARPTVQINTPVKVQKAAPAAVVAATNKKIAAAKPKPVKLVLPTAPVQAEDEDTSDDDTSSDDTGATDDTSSADDASSDDSSADSAAPAGAAAA